MPFHLPAEAGEDNESPSRFARSAARARAAVVSIHVKKLLLMPVWCWCAMGSRSLRSTPSCKRPECRKPASIIISSSESAHSTMHFPAARPARIGPATHVELLPQQTHALLRLWRTPANHSPSRRRYGRLIDTVKASRNRTSTWLAVSGGTRPQASVR